MSHVTPKPPAGSLWAATDHMLAVERKIRNDQQEYERGAFVATRAELRECHAEAALARRTDPDTSRRAAERVVSGGTTKRHEAECLRLVREYPGRTSLELAGCGTDLTYHQIARRMKHLEELRLIRREDRGGAGALWWAVEVNQ